MSNTNKNQSFSWKALLPAMLLLSIGSVIGFFIFSAFWKWAKPQGLIEFVPLVLVFLLIKFFIIAFVGIIASPFFKYLDYKGALADIYDRKKLDFPFFIFHLPLILYWVSLSPYVLPFIISRIDSIWDVVFPFELFFIGLLLLFTGSIPLLWLVLIPIAVNEKRESMKKKKEANS